MSSIQFGALIQEFIYTHLTKLVIWIKSVCISTWATFCCSFSRWLVQTDTGNYLWYLLWQSAIRSESSIFPYLGTLWIIKSDSSRVSIYDLNSFLTSLQFLILFDCTVAVEFVRSFYNVFNHVQILTFSVCCCVIGCSLCVHFLYVHKLMTIQYFG